MSSQSQSKAPKVFISHASEDKELFAEPFSAALREKGIDAWLDKWEMQAGDSLVQKIFNEGIEKADFFIVILSKNSVTKPWIVEELDAGIINKINNGTKLIPVVIEDCEVPQALKSTLWQTISNSDTPESVAHSIANNIFGVSGKPELGTPPAFTQINPSLIFPDLKKIDMIILDLLCHEELVKTSRVIDTKNIVEAYENLGITKSEFSESVEILFELGYIGGSKFVRGSINLIDVSEHIFESYLRIQFSDFDQIEKEVIYLIINENINSSEVISQKLSQKPILIRFMLSRLSNRNLIKLVEFDSGSCKVVKFSQILKRLAE